MIKCAFWELEISYIEVNIGNKIGLTAVEGVVDVIVNFSEQPFVEGTDQIEQTPLDEIQNDPRREKADRQQ